MVKQRGFTLLELLIALGVIAVLTAIAIPAYNNYLQTSRANAARHNLMQLALAEDAYFYDNNTYLSGSYNPDTGTDTLRGPLGWNPQGDDGKFVYTVAACNGGAISTCYTITVTGFGGSVTETLTRP